MRVPVPWLRELAQLPDAISTVDIAAKLTAFDLKLEEILGGALSGPLVVGRVLSRIGEPQKNGKTVNWCRVDVGPEHNEPGDDATPAGRSIVCGAHNFDEGDLVVVSLPGTYLPELGFTIEARKTYGHVSDGMICSRAELGLAGDASGIIVLEPGSASPGDSAIDLLGLGEQTLDLEVNPDRGYAWSLRGVARDAALAYQLEYNDPADIKVESTGEAYPVVVEDPQACARFVVREVSGFDPTSATPEWMARRLEQCGMRSISLAVDVSNYVMLELGQPNHAYDKAKLSGPLRVRRASAGEKLTTLDDVERTLVAEDLVIADDNGPVGLAGIMGGDRVEIDERSTDIVIEAAHFFATDVFRSSRRHKLSSEAAKRFERGVDPNLPERAAQRVAELLVEFGGGTIADGLTVVGDPVVRDAVTVRADHAAKVAGIDISGERAVQALRANGCVVEQAGDTLDVTPPSWRFDINDANDVAEEVLRVVGYDQVPSVLPAASAGRGLTRIQQLRRRVGMVLAGAGLTEVKTFPFAGPEDFDRLGLDPHDARRTQVMLENPLSSQEPGLTTTLFTGLLKAAALNVGRGHENVEICEIGRVFVPTSEKLSAPIYPADRRPSAEQLAALDAALPDQPTHIGVVMLGERQRSGWNGEGRAASWSDALSVVHLIAASLHLQVRAEPAQYAPFHPGRCAAVIMEGEVVGYAGELHPKVAETYGLPPRTVGAEINFDAMVAAAPSHGPKPDFSAFPVAKEDLAFVVDATVAAGVLQAALADAHEFVETVRLFDVYTGEQVASGRKSLAFAVRLRARGRTLSDDDIRVAREAMIAVATGRFGADLRG